MKPSIHVSCISALPAKPPKRSYRCTIEVHGLNESAALVLLPESLDHPLSPDAPVSRIDLRQLSSGQLCYRAHGEPGFLAVEIPKGGSFEIKDWEMSTFEGRKMGELWITDDLPLASGMTLRKLSSNQLAAPAARPTGPAVLASWTASPTTTTKLRILHRFTFQIPDRSPQS